MADARFFIDGSHAMPLAVNTSASLSLSSEDAHHAAKVLRIKQGESIEIVLRDSWDAFRVRVESLLGTQLTVFIEDALQVSESAHPITLIFGLSKGDKNDTIVRQAVEIGADRLVPVIFDRSVVRLDSEKARTRGERLRAKAHSAAMQAHRSRIPEVLDPVSLKSLDELLSEDALLLVLWEEERETQLFEAVSHNLGDNSKLPITLVVGPEGGISREEIARLRDFGAIPVSLGESILRVDTANAVAVGITIAAIQASAK